ncbi:hypothetical protein PInf_022189 [Phytophthora infestans]|nr:hypothetical protein PInf_022189 [Phytophthora infestans]
MRLGYLLVAIAGLLACSDAAVAVSELKSSKLTAQGNVVVRDQAGDLTADHNTKRTLRVQSDKETEESENVASGKGLADSDDEDERGITPYEVKVVLDLTGARRLWKPIDRRVYDGYTVFYSEKCHKSQYGDFCKKHADV